MASNLSNLVRCVSCGQPMVHLTDEQGNFYCQTCWNARLKDIAQNIAVRIQRGDVSREIIFPGQSLSVGSAAENDLILPLAWVRPHHLLIHQDAGMIRARVADPAAKAFLGSKPLSTQSAMVAPPVTITIPAPQGSPILVELKFQSPDRGAVLIAEDPRPMSTTVPEIADVSPLDETRSIFTPPAISAPTQRISKKPFPRQAVFLSALLLIVVVLLSALFWNDIQRALFGSAEQRQFSQVIEDINQAQTLISSGQYVEAKSLVDDGLRIALAHPSFSDQRLILKSMAASPEIKLGGIGYVRMDDQWLPPEQAAAWKSARTIDDPKIQSLYAQAKAAWDSGTGLEHAENLCDEALAIMAAEPVHPHPMRQGVANLRGSIHDRLTTIAMTAKGFVFYNHHWVTPAERFALEQEAKGLALYKGKWIPQAVAFAAEQRDKGLVLYQNRWMTPDQANVARGLVKFENRWITPAQRMQIIHDRQQAAMAAQQKADAQRIAAREEAARKLQEREQIEAKYPEAYQQSQEFVKAILKSPASAQFQPYPSSKVHITYVDGWYVVVAVVDANNTYGVSLRSKYVCKLRPGPNNQWQADSTNLLDN